MSTTKCVDFAYPTSDHARRFGFAGTGCWVVKVTSWDSDLLMLKTRGVVARRTKEEAYTEASKRPEPWASWAPQTAETDPRTDHSAAAA